MNRDVKGQGEISKLDKGSCLSLLQWLSLVYAIFSTRNQAATCNIRYTLKILLILKCAIFFVALQTLSTSFLERISKKLKSGHIHVHIDGRPCLGYEISNSKLKWNVSTCIHARLVIRFHARLRRPKPKKDDYHPLGNWRKRSSFDIFNPEGMKFQIQN